MAPTGRSEAVPTDPRAAWYAWRSRATMRDDPLSNYEFGLKVGQRMAIERTASWAGLVPLLQDVLDYLIDTAVQREADALESEPEPAA